MEFPNDFIENPNGTFSIKTTATTATTTANVQEVTSKLESMKPFVPQAVAQSKLKAQEPPIPASFTSQNSLFETYIFDNKASKGVKKSSMNFMKTEISQKFQKVRCGNELISPITIDFEGFHSENDQKDENGFKLVQLSINGEQAFILDPFANELIDKTASIEAVRNELITMLSKAANVSKSSKSIIVLHDCRRDIYALANGDFQRIAHLDYLDTQLVCEYLYQDGFMNGLNSYLRSWGEAFAHPLKDNMKKQMRNDVNLFTERPLSSDLFEYAALDVILLWKTIPLLFEILESMNILNHLIDATKQRIQNVFQGNEPNQQFIRFVRHVDYTKDDDENEDYDDKVNHESSYDMVTEEYAQFFHRDDSQNMKGRDSLIKHCNIDRFLEILPDGYELDRLFNHLSPKKEEDATDDDAGDEDEMMQAKRRYITDEICEFVLDCGRKPYALTLSGRRVPLFSSPSTSITSSRALHSSATLPTMSLSTAASGIISLDANNVTNNDELITVTKDDLESFQRKLTNSFGYDNRVGIDGELHRISAIRNKTQHIIGVTMRIGRFFSGSTYALTDLLFSPIHANKSILVLGPPGSGKTSLIREISYQLSLEKTVIIVDTSNEIAGDGDIPHACVGNSRRMMVPSLTDQHRVMIEAIQNHTPQILVIDEIGRPEEVNAAQTSSERGVRLIASAHGSFASIIGNNSLNKLIGGIENTILGDTEARVKNDGKKMKACRIKKPVFDIIIELHSQHYAEFHIINDVETAVDRYLNKEKVRAELRTIHLPTATTSTNTTIGGIERMDSKKQRVSLNYYDYEMKI